MWYHKRMALEYSTSYIADSIAVFQYCKKLADGAMAQVTEEQLCATLDDEMNSLATIAKHMAGNMRSRWTNFLTADGEKPDRDRDTEFTDPPASRGELAALWERGWTVLFETLASLTDDDLPRVITIRGERHSVMQAINRQVAHYAYHCGQIVFLAKHLQSRNWNSLSVPRGNSKTFNSEVQRGERSQR